MCCSKDGFEGRTWQCLYRWQKGAGKKAGGYFPGRCVTGGSMERQSWLGREIMMGLDQKEAHYVRKGLRKPELSRVKQQRVDFTAVSSKVLVKVRAKCTMTPRGREGLAGPGYPQILFGNEER